MTVVITFDFVRIERRCPVFVFDIVQICKALMTNPGLDALAPAERTFNMGGPERCEVISERTFRPQQAA